MLGSRHETIIGRPLVPGASVTVAIEVSVPCCQPQCQDAIVRSQGKGLHTMLSGRCARRKMSRCRCQCSMIARQKLSLLAMQEQFQDAKVLIFKKRRRKNSRRLNGHRQVRDGMPLSGAALRIGACGIWPLPPVPLCRKTHCMQGPAKGPLCYSLISASTPPESCIELESFVLCRT